MFSNRSFKSFACLFIILLAGTAVLSGHAANAQDKRFNGIVVDTKTLAPFELKATVMEVQSDRQPYIIIAEKIILVTQFKIEGKFYETQLLDENGLPLEVSDFKKGQRVAVKAIKLPDNRIIGGIIQVRPNKK